MTPRLFGVDPGVHGAMAELTPTGQLSLWPLPLTLAEGSRVRVRETGSLGRIRAGDVVFVEEMWCRPQDSPYSMLPLWTLAGAIAGAALAKGARVEYVSAREWKKWAGILGREKWESVRVSMEMVGGLRLLKKDHDKADAILVAVYGANRMGWGPLQIAFCMAGD